MAKNHIYPAAQISLQASNSILAWSFLKFSIGISRSWSWKISNKSVEQDTSCFMVKKRQKTHFPNYKKTPVSVHSGNSFALPILTKDPKPCRQKPFFRAENGVSTAKTAPCSKSGTVNDAQKAAAKKSNLSECVDLFTHWFDTSKITGWSLWLKCDCVNLSSNTIDSEPLESELHHLDLYEMLNDHEDKLRLRNLALVLRF